MRLKWHELCDRPKSAKYADSAVPFVSVAMVEESAMATCFAFLVVVLKYSVIIRIVHLVSVEKTNFHTLHEHDSMLGVDIPKVANFEWTCATCNKILIG